MRAAAERDVLHDGDFTTSPGAWQTDALELSIKSRAMCVKVIEASLRSVGCRGLAGQEPPRDGADSGIAFTLCPGGGSSPPGYCEAYRKTSDGIELQR